MFSLEQQPMLFIRDIKAIPFTTGWYFGVMILAASYRAWSFLQRVYQLPSFLYGIVFARLLEPPPSSPYTFSTA